MVTPQMQRVLNAIAELESNGLATRPWALAGLCLSLCQRCGEWTGDGCARISGGRAAVAEALVDASWVCPQWAALHQTECD